MCSVCHAPRRRATCGTRPELDAASVKLRRPQLPLVLVPRPSLPHLPSHGNGALKARLKACLVAHLDTSYAKSWFPFIGKHYRHKQLCRECRTSESAARASERLSHAAFWRLGAPRQRFRWYRPASGTRPSGRSSCSGRCPQQSRPASWHTRGTRSGRAACPG